jgi:hypothetical protein
MKRIYYGEADFLVGDEAADTLVEYAVLMAKLGTADSVQVGVIGPDGNAEVATFVIGPATILMVETTRSELPEPDNAEAIKYMAERTEVLSRDDSTMLFDPDVFPNRSMLDY